MSRETHFYCDGEQAPAQAVQGGCGVSILENTQKLADMILGNQL